MTLIRDLDLDVLKIYLPTKDSVIFSLRATMLINLIKFVDKGI